MRGTKQSNHERQRSKLISLCVSTLKSEEPEINVGEISVLLVRVDGEFHAIGSKCSHFGAPLAEGVLHEQRVRCPWHQACFNVVTGDLEEPPALDALPHVDVRVEGEDIIVSIPEEAKEQRLPTMTRKKLDADSHTFAIIGTGGAGNAAAEALRQDGFQGRVVMVTKENRLPDDRTGLSKSYLKSDDSEPEYLRSAEFYDDYDIEILTRHEVVNVDTADKSVLFHDGSPLKYDKLLLATGSTPRRLNIPGASLDVHEGVEHRLISAYYPLSLDKAEAFIKILSTECLTLRDFANVQELSQFVEQFLDYYNQYRGHGSLGYQPPITWYAGVAPKVAGLGGIPGLEKVAQQWSGESAAEAPIYVTQELMAQRKALVPLAA